MRTLAFLILTPNMKEGSNLKPEDLIRFEFDEDRKDIVIPTKEDFDEALKIYGLKK